MKLHLLRHQQTVRLYNHAEDSSRWNPLLQPVITLLQIQVIKLIHLHPSVTVLEVKWNSITLLSGDPRSHLESGPDF